MRRPATTRRPARLLAGLLLGLAACVTPGARLPGAGSSTSASPPEKGARRGIQELYVSPGVLQHFLLPQPLKGPGGQQGKLDLVVRDSAQVPRYGLLHLSIVAPTAVSLPGDTLLLTTKGQPLALRTARVLYTEPKGKARLTRLEALLTPAQTTAYLQSPTKAVLLGSVTGRRRFEFAEKERLVLEAFAAYTTSPGH